MRVFGITGTCGKTTTTYLMEGILTASGCDTGVIGTQNIRFGRNVEASTHTTPSASSLFRVLAQMRRAGITDVVTEVSSHALAQKRTLGMLFDFAVFTNLSTEHLDLHGTMEEYFEAKSLLFTDYAIASRAAGKRHTSVIHVRDNWGQRLAARIAIERVSELVTFGLSDADIQWNSLTCSSKGIHGDIEGLRIESRLVGRFNAENILGAVALALASGVPKDSIENGINSVHSVPGRLERVASSGVSAFADYAHKPGALSAVLQALRSFLGAGRLICVFGCGGDRDKAKRPEMAKVAEELADVVILTSDNPRTEDAESIEREILTGFRNPSAVLRISDRREAIRTAVAIAKAADSILVAGRGAETHQIFADRGNLGGTITVPFDDREVLREELAKQPLRHRPKNPDA